MRRLVIYLCVFMMTWTLASRSPSFGMISNDLAVEEIPPRKLIKNICAYIKQRPQEAEPYYELGRVYSVLYASNRATIPAAFKTRNGGRLPYGRATNSPMDFGEPYDMTEGGVFAPLDEVQEKYLRLSLENYKKALEFGNAKKTQTRVRDERYSYYLLGYGWMLEQGMRFAKLLPAPFKTPKSVATAEEWRNESLKALRRVYREYMPPKEELENTFHYNIPAEEAAESIARLQQESADPQSKQEVAEIRTWLALLSQGYRVVSPVIFPLNGRDTLSQLVAPRKAVRFDLMGDRTGARWSWVNARAGILVWDPRHTGRVRSGYQLFGNVTWCMIWKHGYAPLARLDANGDGWLTGKELEGIAVWRDKNGNGVADKGEVVSLRKLGIARISVKALVGGDGVYWNPKGIIRRDGTAIPTYDWIAKTKTAGASM